LSFSITSIRFRFSIVIVHIVYALPDWKNEQTIPLRAGNADGKNHIPVGVFVVMQERYTMSLRRAPAQTARLGRDMLNPE